MAGVVLEQITKTFDSTEAVRNIDLEIAEGEFVVLVGPSGCGKSTTLRMVAGLEEITSGRILIDDRVVNDVPPKDRNIAMVFQNYALYPHMPRMIERPLVGRCGKKKSTGEPPANDGRCPANRPWHLYATGVSIAVWNHLASHDTFADATLRVPPHLVFAYGAVGRLYRDRRLRVFLPSSGPRR